MKKIIALAISALVLVACGSKQVGEPVKKLADYMEQAAKVAISGETGDIDTEAIEAELTAFLDENAAYELTDADKDYLVDRLYDVTVSSGALEQLGEAEKAMAEAAAKPAIKEALNKFKTLGDLKELNF